MNKLNTSYYYRYYYYFAKSCEAGNRMYNSANT